MFSIFNALLVVDDVRVLETFVACSKRTPCFAWLMRFFSSSH